MDTRELGDDVTMPGHQWSLGEQRETIRRMRALNHNFYDAQFAAGMGTRCHAFVEFCGLQSKFIDLCEAALNDGVEFPFANQHSGTSMPMAAHHADYLGEKFACIYGFMLDQNPTLREAFVKSAFSHVESPTEGK